MTIHRISFGMIRLFQNQLSSFTLRLNAETPNKQSLEADSSNLLKHYPNLIIERKDTLQMFCNHIVLEWNAARTYFSKKSSVEGIIGKIVLNIILRLRSDFVLQNLYLGEYYC